MNWFQEEESSSSAEQPSSSYYDHRHTGINKKNAKNDDYGYHEDEDEDGNNSNINNNNSNNNNNSSMMMLNNIQERDIDTLLANELNQMTLEERERTYEAIHGVERITQETPELVQDKLVQFEDALQRILLLADTTTTTTSNNNNSNNSKKNTTAYLLALQQDPDYVRSAKFRLMFLRSTHFDVHAAAQKLVDFLQGKLELFGPQTLTRSLYLTDLDANDMACLMSGAYQLLPSRDSTGRAAIVDFHLIVQKCYRHPINLLRTLTFLQLAAAEDEETQKHGIIGIVYYVGTFNGDFNHTLNKQVAAISKWFPIRIVAYHICYDDPRIRAWKPLAMFLMGKDMRVRARFHDGTHTEVRYSLMTFGVPVAHLPISYQGEVKTANHAKWIARRRYKEEYLQSVGYFDGIDLPTRNDVILRRGRVFHDHPGNQKMRQLLSAVQEEYSQAPLKKKADVAMRIVQTIKSEGGRFLERDQADGWWIPVNDKEACKRVGKAIRTMRQNIAAKQEQEHNNDDDYDEDSSFKMAPTANTTSTPAAFSQAHHHEDHQHHHHRGKRSKLSVTIPTDNETRHGHDCLATAIPCLAPSSLD